VFSDNIKISCGKTAFEISASICIRNIWGMEILDEAPRDMQVTCAVTFLHVCFPFVLFLEQR